MADRPLDPRINAYRADLAALCLKGQVDAPKFAEGTSCRVIRGVAPLRRAPRDDAPLDSEVLLGEGMTIYEENGGWAWGQVEDDNYVGYVSTDALRPGSGDATHRVGVQRTHLYPEADISAPPQELLNMNACVRVESTDGQFARLDDGRYAVVAHLRPLDETVPDFVSVAEWFVGTPYLWGGRTSIGLDCSALVQLSLQAAGLDCPRDSDMQQEALGEALPVDDTASCKRGDLIFWAGHAGIVRGKNSLLHATATFMSTVVEPLDEAVLRIAEAGNPVTAIRRLS